MEPNDHLQTVNGIISYSACKQLNATEKENQLLTPNTAQQILTASCYVREAIFKGLQHWIFWKSPKNKDQTSGYWHGADNRGNQGNLEVRKLWYIFFVVLVFAKTQNTQQTQCISVCVIKNKFKTIIWYYSS